MHIQALLIRQLKQALILIGATDIGLPKPDLVCFMDNKLICLDERDTYGEERYERNDFQKMVFENFKKIFNLESDCGVQLNNDLLILNAKDSIQSIHEVIFENVFNVIQKQQTIMTPLGTLWCNSLIFYFS